MHVDLLISNASVLSPYERPASTLAIQDGKIHSVGADRADLTAKEEIDAGGGLVLAGFQDAHVHPVHGGEILTTCDLNQAHPDHNASGLDHDDVVAGYRSIVSEFAARTKGWITGGGWHFEVFPRGIPTRHLLDDLTGDRPAYLTVADGHAAWANTAALRAAGITAETPDPRDGRIEREADGTPNGCLQEGAMGLVERVIPDRTPSQFLDALLAGHDHLISFGITSWQDAMVSPEIQQAYLKADAEGRLRAKVRGALWWERERGIEQIEELLERRQARSPRFMPDSVKLMLDGVCENFTAALLGSYTDADGRPTGNTGIDFIDPEALPSYVSRLHAEGFQAHFHALGCRSVRNALNAIEFATGEHGPKDLRHTLAHLQIIDPEDIPRFAKLGAVANAQPLWAVHEEAMDDLTIPFLGDRADLQYPFASLEKSGARLAFGSDWSVSSPNPLFGIEVAVHRHFEPVTDRPFLPHERISLRTALQAYTEGAAFVSHMDTHTGTLAVGMDADVVILDGDPFVDGHAAGLSVTHTVIDGVIEYRKES